MQVYQQLVVAWPMLSMLDHRPAVGDADFLAAEIPWLNVMWLYGLNQFNVMVQDVLLLGNNSFDQSVYNFNS